MKIFIDEKLGYTLGTAIEALVKALVKNDPEFKGITPKFEKGRNTCIDYEVNDDLALKVYRIVFDFITEMAPYLTEPEPAKKLWK